MVLIFATLEGMPAIEVVAVLRERNQLTLPERIVEALGARAGDHFAISFDEATPGSAELRTLPRSYAGVAGDLYGRSAEERAVYIADERASWGDGEDPGRARDGTPYLSFEESRRIYRQTEVTRERYDREPKLRWPKCAICGRSIANMREHRARHAAGRFNRVGVSTESAQVARSRKRVRKWRASMAARAKGPRR